MIRSLSKLYKDCKGATAVEYGLIITLVVLAMVAGLSAFAGTTIDMWNDVAEKVSET